jgi:tetratricopeptide (TPR) repeat protein
MDDSAGGVSVWEEELIIPTYRVGPDDRNPPILMGRRNPIHPGSSIIYPYPVQEWLTRTREERKWRAVILENEYLRLTVLPDLGGHLLSAFDRVANEEALYRNHVLKYARIGIRGAWVSGGIEWNFPNGHTVTTTSPIDYRIRKNRDGCSSIIIGDIERVSRMRWSVSITLYPRSSYFETEIRLFNRTQLPNRFWYWANSAIPASPGLEFITTATRVMTLQDVMNYPIHDGVNIRWDRNHLEPQDLFSLNSSQDFVAWYNHDLERGMINYARRTDAPGKKFYTWGNSDDGNIWTELLTDEDGPYAEMQSGRLLTMRVWEIMQAGTTETWKEAWYPIRRIGTPVYANRRVAVSLQSYRGRLRLGVHATSPEPGAAVVLHSGSRRIWGTRLDLDPAAPYLEEIDLEGKRPGREGFRLELFDGTGNVIGMYDSRADRPAEREIRGTIKIEPDADARTAEELWRAGVEYEKIGDFPLAEECYLKALERDRGYSPARRSLGTLLLRRGKLDRACDELQRALGRNGDDDAARFYLGVARLGLEHFDEAIEEFMVLSRSASFGPAAAQLLGGLYLGKSSLDEAVDQLERAHRLCPENSDTLALLASAYRKRGMYGEARDLLEATLERDGLNFMALIEAYFLETEQDTDRRSQKLTVFRRILREEPQSYIELSCDYARFGLYTEAVAILELHIEERKESGGGSPLIHFYLGYFLEKLGESKRAAAAMRRGSAMDHDLVFPHRIESEMVLRRVLELLPDSGKVPYYLGNLLCSRDRLDEAVPLWKRAARKEPGLSVIHRNLGRTYWKVLDEPGLAVQEYERALKCAPEDYKLYYELDKIYTALGLADKRRNLIRSIPEELLENDMIAERVAAFYTDRRDFDRSLEILRATQFFPWEFYTEGRSLYEDTCIGRGNFRMERTDYAGALECYGDFMTYPRNMGVGEPHRKRHAEALYRMGLAWEKLGDRTSAEKRWEETVREVHTEDDVLRYYQARALQKLGRRKEAAAFLDTLQGIAERNLIDKSGKEGHNLYLLGLARKGMGDAIQAHRCFKKALAADGSLRRCSWELEGHAGE